MANQVDDGLASRFRAIVPWSSAAHRSGLQRALMSDAPGDAGTARNDVPPAMNTSIGELDVIGRVDLELPEARQRRARESGRATVIGALRVVASTGSASGPRPDRGRRFEINPP
jgi:hypothetical protein